MSGCASSQRTSVKKGEIADKTNKREKTSEREEEERKRRRGRTEEKRKERG